MWHDESKVLSGGTLTIALATSYYYNMSVSQSPGALGDSFQQNFAMASGTYTLFVMGYTSTNRGQVTFTIDGVTQGTIDLYNATGGESISSIGVTITTTGVHSIIGTVTGRNGASTGYLIPLNKYWIR
jgi:hypothetical protein